MEKGFEMNLFKMKKNRITSVSTRIKSESLIKQYFENSTINGYSHLVAKRRTIMDRFLWIAVHVTAIISTAYIVGSIVHEYTKGPTITTQSSVPEPLSLVQFPAIAICDVNRISKKAALEMATDIITSKGLNYTVGEMMKLLVNLGEIYTFIPIDEKAVDELHEVLGNYDLEEVMTKLTPSCDSLLQRCRWKREIRNCSDILATRKTQIGYCCTFNYLLDLGYTGDSPDLTPITPVITTNGRDFGLTVVVNPNMEDDFFSISTCDGVQVYIYNPFDFPDSVSGSLLQVAIQAAKEVEISLNADTLFAYPQVKTIPAGIRGCLFNSELPTLFDGFYSYSNCMVSCRVADMLALCGCQPFYLPAPNNKMISCLLSDLPCFRKYSGKWLTVLPSGIEDEKGLELDDVYGGLSCTLCYPACSSTTYYTEVTSASLNVDDLNAASDHNKTPYKRGIVFKDHSIIHIFFDHPVITSYKQEVLYSWYDFLSNCGGIFGLVMGLSFISIIEIVYFVWLCIKKKWKKTLNSKTPFRYSIYWDEIKLK